MSEFRLIPTVREYEHEKRVEYRGVVITTESIKEIDVCTHQHRTRPAALACGKRMCRKLRQQRKNVV